VQPNIIRKFKEILIKLERDKRFFPNEAYVSNVYEREIKNYVNPERYSSIEYFLNVNWRTAPVVIYGVRIFFKPLRKFKFVFYKKR